MCCGGGGAVVSCLRKLNKNKKILITISSNRVVSVSDLTSLYLSSLYFIESESIERYTYTASA